MQKRYVKKQIAELDKHLEAKKFKWNVGIFLGYFQLQYEIETYVEEVAQERAVKEVLRTHHWDAQN